MTAPTFAECGADCLYRGIPHQHVAYCVDCGADVSGVLGPYRHDPSCSLHPANVAPTYQVSAYTGVSRPAFSPSGQMWDWTPHSESTHRELAGAIAAAEAIPAADGLMVQLCRYPAPDPHTAPCMAQRIGRGPWRSHGGELASLAELLSAAPQ